MYQLPVTIETLLEGKCCGTFWTAQPSIILVLICDMLIIFMIIKIDDRFKDKQKEVILNFVSGRDVFAALPTGYGKSLCYGCLPGVVSVHAKALLLLSFHRCQCL